MDATEMTAVEALRGAHDAVSKLPKLRVLVVSHAYVTGVNQGKLDVIAATGRADVGLLVPTSWQALGWQKSLTLERPYHSIAVYPAKIFFSGRVGAYIYRPWSIWRVIKDFKPDILHVEQEVFSLSALQLAIAAKFFNLPMTIFGWENMDRQLSSLRKWVRQTVLDTVQVVIPGNQEGEELVKRWGYTGTIEIMPQIGVDAALFAPQTNLKKPSESQFRIGYVGRFTYEKGLDTLFSAVQQLSQQTDDVRLIMCGSGPDEAKLKAEAKALGIDDFVIWHGKIAPTKVPNEIATFDVLALPSKTGDSWKEQFGHVLIEAMCMGVPVVGSTCGEIPNVIGNPDYVFPEGDARRLSSILSRMKHDPNWHEQARAHGLKRVHQYYTHERIATRLLELWQASVERYRQCA
ncbi:MAG: glycosyltransferase [Cyanobacteria bacterium P01_D01_bin.1]